MFRARWSRAGRFLVAGALAAPLLVGTSLSTGASSKDPMRNRVLWVKGDRAYVALSDTSRVAEGDSVRFEDRRKHVAGGRVLSVVHGEMAIVSLTYGSLDRVKLERAVVATIRPALAAPGVLRIAIPADDRDNLLFGCAAVTPQMPAEAPSYRSEQVGPREFRFTRVDPASNGAPWPDTLIVVLFPNPIDEEIALERGDVDIAVFWPGELSPRLRQDARWSGHAFGTRSRGILALVEVEGMTDAAPDTAWLSAFNDALFRGDLGLRDQRPRQPWVLETMYRIEADGELPGRKAIGQWLTRHGADPAVRISLPPEAKHPRARMAFVNAPSDTTSADGFIPLLQVRVPVLCGPNLRPLVRALGVGTLANLAQCSGTAAP